MKELRLLPAAILTWAVVLATLLSEGPWWGLVLLGCGSVLLFFHLGSGLATVSIAAAGWLSTWWRLRAAPTHVPSLIHAKIAASPTPTKHGGWLLELSSNGTTFRGFSREPPPPLGSEVLAAVSAKPNDSPELAPIMLQVSKFELVQPPTGLAAWSTHIKQEFLELCAQHLGPSSAGLIPGMVLGDTSAQPPVQQEMFLATGLTHLTAVSGANITILTGAAVLLAKGLTLGPRVQVALAALVLLLYAHVVGFEPSVLRASVMGIVGLLAIVGSSQVEPAHALCLAVIALLLFDPDLASSFGFALSVVATAGLVALSPLIYRALARTAVMRKVPDIVVRAFSVALAADIVTMPLVAALGGKLIVSSVFANILVAPAVVPVTVLGFLAVVLPDPIAGVMLRVAEPFAWWIAQVARGLHEGTKIPTTPVWAVLLAGWSLWLIHHRKAYVVALAVLLALPLPRCGAGAVDLNNVIHLDRLPRDYAAPEGTDAIVVWEEGAPSKRPHQTATGVPILYPLRDGPVVVQRDGSQRASRGHF